MLRVLVPSKTDEFLGPLLDSMEASEPGSSGRVLVGDNGISGALKARWPQVTFVPVPRPFVFAKAINACARAAEADGVVDLLVLNDDTLVATPHWVTMIEQLLAAQPDAAASDHGYGLVSLEIDGGVGNEDQKARGRAPLEIEETKKTVCFVAGVVPGWAWARIGPLDERYTGYGFDDDDYCKRLWDAGLRTGVTGAATVKHGAAGYPHSSTFARELGAAEWTRRYELNGRIFQAKWGLGAVANRRCLNLGCGDKPRPNEGLDAWTNLDLKPGPGVQVVRDLRRGLPFGDGAFDHVLCDNVLEHFGSADVIFLINEIDRVLKVGGTAEIVVPHAHSQGAIQDPTHRTFFVPRSAMYWNQVTTPYGGRFVGIEANLITKGMDVYGDEKTELFIRFRLEKQAPPERAAVAR
jgi:SAM-dependent methyltransferase